MNHPRRKRSVQGVEHSQPTYRALEWGETLLGLCLLAFAAGHRSLEFVQMDKNHAR